MTGPKRQCRTAPASIPARNELRYWSKKLGVTQDQLKAAVKKVGNSVSAVEKELKAT
jgi:stage III sporulation protein SpoIIIAA